MSYDKTLLTTPTNLSFEQYGSGTALLLLHGFPFDHSIWEAQCNDLKSVCRVITLDLRGHGHSPSPVGAYSVDVMAQDILNVLNKIGVYKAIWVGHSLGGYITLAGLRLAPERFAGVALVASSYLADTPEAQAKRYETIEKVAKDGAEAVINLKLFKEGTPPDSPIVEKINRIIRATPPTGIIGTLQAMATRPDSTETVKRIRVPALVVGGQHDQVFKPEIPEQIAELIPDSQLVMVDSGHLPMLDQPDTMTRALEGLLARVN
jgi:3-oxoadipate enol-lactonase